MEGIVVGALIGLTSGAILGYSKNFFGAVLVFAAGCIIGFYVLLGAPRPGATPYELVAEFVNRVGFFGPIALVVAAFIAFYLADRYGPRN